MVDRYQERLWPGGHREIVTNPKGKYVLASDYDALAARIAVLEAELAHKDAYYAQFTLVPKSSALETKVEFCDLCERPLVAGKCPSPICTPGTCDECGIILIGEGDVHEARCSKSKIGVKDG